LSSPHHLGAFPGTSRCLLRCHLGGVRRFSGHCSPCFSTVRGNTQWLGQRGFSDNPQRLGDRGDFSDNPQRAGCTGHDPAASSGRYIKHDIGSQVAGKLANPAMLEVLPVHYLLQKLARMLPRELGRLGQLLDLSLLPLWVDHPIHRRHPPHHDQSLAHTNHTLANTANKPYRLRNGPPEGFDLDAPHTLKETRFGGALGCGGGLGLGRSQARLVGRGQALPPTCAELAFVPGSRIVMLLPLRVFKLPQYPGVHLAGPARLLQLGLEPPSLPRIGLTPVRLPGCRLALLPCLLLEPPSLPRIGLTPVRLPTPGRLLAGLGPIVMFPHIPREHRLRVGGGDDRPLGGVFVHSEGRRHGFGESLHGPYAQHEGE
jgi:hypothetical protein